MLLNPSTQFSMFKTVILQREMQSLIQSCNILGYNAFGDRSEGKMAKCYLVFNLFICSEALIKLKLCPDNILEMFVISL